MRIAYYSRYNRKNAISTAGKQITWGMGTGEGVGVGGGGRSWKEQKEKLEEQLKKKKKIKARTQLKTSSFPTNGKLDIKKTINAILNS